MLYPLITNSIATIPRQQRLSYFPLCPVTHTQTGLERFRIRRTTPVRVLVIAHISVCLPGGHSRTTRGRKYLHSLAAPSLISCSNPRYPCSPCLPVSHSTYVAGDMNSSNMNSRFLRSARFQYIKPNINRGQARCALPIKGPSLNEKHPIEPTALQTQVSRHLGQSTSHAPNQYGSNSAATGRLRAPIVIHLCPDGRPAEQHTRDGGTAAVQKQRKSPPHDRKRNRITAGKSHIPSDHDKNQLDDLDA